MPEIPLAEGVPSGVLYTYLVASLTAGPSGVASVNDVMPDLAGNVELTPSDIGADVSGAAAAVQLNLDAHEDNLSNPHQVTKTQIGLGNADNTSDANKPISTATAAALLLKANLVGGVIPTSEIPAIAITEYLGSVANQAAMLALVGQKGDWCIRTDSSLVYIITGADPSILANWTALAYPASPVTSVNGQVGLVVLNAGNVGADPAGTAAAVQDNLDDHESNYANPHPHAVTALTSTGGVLTLNCALGDYFTHTMTEDTTLAITNPPAAAKAQTIKLRILQNAVAAKTLTLPNSFCPVADSDTDIQTGLGSYTLLEADTFDQGTRWDYDMRGIAASYVFTPQELFDAGYLGAWQTAYTQEFLTVNSDGTGGAPSVGGTARRAVDRSPSGGYHLLRASGVAPTVDTDALVFPYVPGIARSDMRSTTNGFAGNSQSFTMLWHGDVYGLPDITTYGALDNASGNNFELTGAYTRTDGSFQILTNGAFVNTGLKVESLRTVICCRGSASGFELWVNNRQFTRAALTSVTLKDLNIMGGASTKIRFKEMLVLKSAITDPEFANLRAYGATKAGYLANNTDVLLARGDSIFGGVGSALCKPWVARRTQMPNALVYNYAKEGEAAYSPATGPATNLNTAYKGLGRNVIVFMMGTNDIFSFGRTAAQVETAIRNYLAVFYAAGWSVVVCTLADIVGHTTTVNDSNTLIRASAVGLYAHVICDFGADARFQNSANPTYFNADGVHWTDALQQAAAELADAAILAAP